MGTYRDMKRNHCAYEGRCRGWSSDGLRVEELRGMLNTGMGQRKSKLRFSGLGLGPLSIPWVR